MGRGSRGLQRCWIGGGSDGDRPTDLFRVPRLVAALAAAHVLRPLVDEVPATNNATQDQYEEMQKERCCFVSTIAAPPDPPGSDRGESADLGTVAFTPCTFTAPFAALSFRSRQYRPSFFAKSAANAGMVAAALWLWAKRWLVITTWWG